MLIYIQIKQYLYKYRIVVHFSEKLLIMSNVIEAPCSGCGVAIGQQHEHNCDREECPFCHGQLSFCSCIHEKLNIPFDVEEFSDEQEEQWEKILQQKGFILFGSENPNQPKPNYRIGGMDGMELKALAELFLQPK